MSSWGRAFGLPPYSFSNMCYDAGGTPKCICFIFCCYFVLFDCLNVRNKSVKHPGVKVVDTHSPPLTLKMVQGKAEMYRHTQQYCDSLTSSSCGKINRYLADRYPYSIHVSEFSLKKKCWTLGPNQIWALNFSVTLHWTLTSIPLECFLLCKLDQLSHQHLSTSRLPEMDIYS